METTEEMIEDMLVSAQCNARDVVTGWVIQSDYVRQFLTQLANSIHEQSALEAERRREKHEPHKDDKSWCYHCGYNQALTDLAKHFRFKVIE